MKKTKLFLMIALILFCAFPMVAESIFDSINDGWKLDLEGKEEIVNIPHTWNDEDTLAGLEKPYFRGVGTYAKSFDFTPMKDKRYFLLFEGANQVCEFFVNGKSAGIHKGGYNSFAFEVSAFLVSGENNFTIKMDNSYDDTIIPHVGDFNMYGGIYRPMHFLEKNKVTFDRTGYTTNGAMVYTTLEEDLKTASVVVETKIDDKNWENYLVQASVLDAEKNVVANTTIDFANGDAKKSFAVEAPRLWNGVEDPYQYSIELKLVAKKGSKMILDYISLPIGFKHVKIDPVEGFFLNGEHYKIQGVCRHQDFMNMGNALTSEQHKLDFEIMAEMGVNSVRLSHYPHAKEVHELANDYGMLIWTEIPFVGGGGYAGDGYDESPEFYANTELQLREMIAQHMHNPSVFTWGLFNELKKEGRGPLALIQTLNEVAHEMDPSRYTTCATNNNLDFNPVTDLLAWNKYFGWYGSSASFIGNWADGEHKKDPTKPLGISEYGAGASHFQYSDNNTPPIPTGRWHPENYQTYFHEKHWMAIAPRDFLWGTYVWNMFDFAAWHRSEGDRLNINDKGLVTFDRKYKKDAFYFYKANWSKNSVLHLCESARTEHKKKWRKVRLYSNLNETTLTVNGKAIKLKDEGYHVFESNRISFKKSENTIELKAKDAQGEVVTQSVVWIY